MTHRSDSRGHGEHANQGAAADRVDASHDPVRRRRTALVSGAIAVAAIAAITGVVLLAGILQPAQVDTSPTHSPTATVPETPRPAPTATADPVPTQAPVDADATDASGWMVTQEGIGPFRLGMTFGDASALVGEGTNCGRGEPEPPVIVGLDHHLWILGDDEGSPMSGGLAVVEWTSQVGGSGPDLRAGPRTPEGIGVGSSEAEVRSAYPSVAEVGRSILYLRDGRVFFGVREGIVTSIGTTVADIPYEYCG